LAWNLTDKLMAKNEIERVEMEWERKRKNENLKLKDGLK
jgi:hypothetical protein